VVHFAGLKAVGEKSLPYYDDNLIGTTTFLPTPSQERKKVYTFFIYFAFCPLALLGHMIPLSVVVG
jgi:UDP-glucose 4-epimerase